MKYFLVSMMILLQNFVFAQIGDIVKDSFWITQSGYTITTTTGQTKQSWEYIKNVYIEYDNLYTDGKGEPIGDSANAVRALVAWQIEEIDLHAELTARSMQKPRLIRNWIETNKEMQRVGLAPLETVIQSRYERDFIGAAKVRVSGGNWQEADIVKAANGNLRLLYGNQGWRITLFSSRLIRLNAWPTTGKSVDLYRLRPGYFSSYDRDIILKLE
jgi:hypothetical protein